MLLHQSLESSVKPSASVSFHGGRARDKGRSQTELLRARGALARAQRDRATEQMAGSQVRGVSHRSSADAREVLGRKPRDVGTHGGLQSDADGGTDSVLVEGAFLHSPIVTEEASVLGQVE
eukprot:5084614-Alexandrium_andersonii.AAC.1